jgi:molybdopterin converting factor small subunit
MQRNSSGGGSRQQDLVPRCKRPTIPIADDHKLVRLTDTLDWTELEDRAQQIRASKLKNAAGRPPHLRATLGAMLLMAGRRLTYREAEDLIRYYAPARYLCGLTETEWTPDFTTIQDFTDLMGEEGIRLFNQYVVGLAVERKLADPRTLVADTTAQEAAIPHPNEIGLMASFLTSVTAASRKVGRALRGFVGKTVSHFEAARQKVREYRLFAKTKEKKTQVMARMATIVEKINKHLGAALQVAAPQQTKLRKYALVAKGKLVRLQQVMSRLLPQIRYWLRTGWVASGKIISVHIPELYSIVRGKVGKSVEFGLRWGIARLQGGYLLATLAKDRQDLLDSKFALRAVIDHIALFGKAPQAYAYDRGGYSAPNLAALKNLGVKHVALAPQGRTPWAVSRLMRDRLVRERALIEAGIGTIKIPRYGFNRPAARSVAMMGACGQRAVLGFNATKLVRELAKRKQIAVTG